MTPTHFLKRPLAITGATAVGAAGLNAAAVGAAMWSHVARFELVEGHPWGVPDVLRLGLCPLFDRTTPWPERLQALLACCQQISAPSAGPAPIIHLLATKRAEAAIAQGMQPAPFTLHRTHGGLVAALEAIGAQAGRNTPAPRGLIVAVDSLIDQAGLLARYQSGGLSTEDKPGGVVASEGAAMLVLMGLPQAAAANAGVLGVVRSACAVNAGDHPMQALTFAVNQALGDRPAAPHTILWDVGDDNARVNTIAEALLMLGPVVQGAQLVRPVQYTGCTGLCFAAQAIVLALQGSRAGLTRGGLTLVCSLDAHSATALLIESPWRPHIMLADAQDLRP